MKNTIFVLAASECAFGAPKGMKPLDAGGKKAPCEVTPAFTKIPECH